MDTHTVHRLQSADDEETTFDKIMWDVFLTISKAGYK